MFSVHTLLGISNETSTHHHLPQPSTSSRLHPACETFSVDYRNVLHIYNLQIGKQNRDDPTLQERWRRIYVFEEVRRTSLCSCSIKLHSAGPATPLNVRSCFGEQNRPIKFFSLGLTAHRNAVYLH